MAYVPRRSVRSYQPYGVRSVGPRPYVRPYYAGAAPIGGGVASSGLASSALGGALGALGGTLGCLLCLSAIGALGLFSCVVAITAYTKRFLDAFKTAEGVNDNSSNAAGQMQIASIVMLCSVIYAFACRLQRH